MKISCIKIENFRSHSQTEIPISQFGCLIGENNSGKSSVLHAIQIMLDDRKITESDYKDANLPIKITITITDISKEDLERVNSKHQTDVSNMLIDNALTLIKTQSINGKSSEIKYLEKQPINENLIFNNIKDNFKNISGSELYQKAVSLVPDLKDKISEQVTQTNIKSALEDIIKNLSEDKFTFRPSALKTGIPQSLKPLYPSIIYIEAVKDASVEAKPTGTAALSKLMSILFEEVSEEFSDLSNKLQKSLKGLSVQLDEEGNTIDNRINAVKQIEKNIEKNIQESFPEISINLKLPAPNLSMIFNNAELEIDDGHLGPVSTKGDGLQRTVLFSLIRSFTSIRDNGLNKEISDTAEGNYYPHENKKNLKPYLLLFEEPELYLHPRAQRQLMSALAKFSSTHQVLVTTHSPSFFRPETTGFAKLKKNKNGEVVVTPVDIRLELRQAYQIIQYENNEAAFFGEKIVLVEGDSDVFTFPHLAKIIDRKWDNIDRNIIFIKIGGKGNIKKYKDFFASFGVPVHAIIDADTLVNGFSQLTDEKSILDKYSKLTAEVDKKTSEINCPKSDKVKSIAKRTSAKQLWVDAQYSFKLWNDSKETSHAENIMNNLSKLFSQGSDSEKEQIIISSDLDSEILKLRNELLDALSEKNIHILKYGDLEVYCDTHVGQDKVKTAMEFCRDNNTLDKYRDNLGDNSSKYISDLNRIFSSIFS